MSSLQKINLGTPPKAEDGDPVRTANVKANENVDVLNAQSALTSAAQLVNSAQALTAALHLGKRVNISLAAPGVINPPAASTCTADSVILLRNIGTTVATLAPLGGSGDMVALSKLNPGETALIDTDGVHAWTVLMRGRTNSDNEVVNGNLVVNRNLVVNGITALTGVTDASAAAAGKIGERITTTGGGVPVTSGVPKTVASVLLQPGYYEVSGTVKFNSTGVASQIHASISLTDNTLDTNIGRITSLIHVASTINTSNRLSSPSTIVNVSVPTTVYLVSQQDYSGTTTCDAFLVCWRRN